MAEAPDPAPPAAVLLCAGGSTRMGRTKALLPWGDRTLLEAHLASLGTRRVRVVLGARAEALLPFLDGVELAWNHDWATSPMGASARIGAQGLDGPALFIPIDTVPDASIVARLSERTRTTVPLDREGRRGHPLLLSAADVRALAEARDPNLRRYSGRAETMETTSSLCARDFDTPEALAAVREEVARGGLEPPTPRV